MLCGQKCLKTTHLGVKSVGLGIRLLALEALTSCFMQIYSFFPLASVLWSVKWRQCTVSLRMRLWVLTDDCFVDKTCLTLFDPMDCSTIGLPVFHCLPEFVQIHVHWVGDAIQPSRPLSSPPPAFNLSQHRGLFQGVSSSHQVAAEVLEFHLQHQSFQWIFRTDFL